jgi:hypothetical protein
LPLLLFFLVLGVLCLMLTTFSVSSLFLLCPGQTSTQILAERMELD